MTTISKGLRANIAPSLRDCNEAADTIDALVEALEELQDALMDGLCNYGLPDFDKGRLGRAQDRAEAILAKARGE